jgi:hypothetical protein
MRDPPPDRKKAVTPNLLRDMKGLARNWGKVSAHTSDLIEGAFFFAMRACEFCKVKKRGRTRALTLSNVTFRDKRGKTVLQTDTDLEDRAEFVTICFVDQKNGKRMDRRTQRRTQEKLCPVKAWARVCRRVRETIPGASGETQAFTLGNPRGQIVEIDSERVNRLLKITCRVYSKNRGYGISEQEIGTRSIRSGAAMALFLMDHSVEKIMILGRWSSDAFMVYIRPQVLEWTNIMSKDMARAGNFHDLNSRKKRLKPRLDKRVLADPKTIPRFYMGR